MALIWGSASANRDFPGQLELRLLGSHLIGWWRKKTTPLRQLVQLLTWCKLILAEREQFFKSTRVIIKNRVETQTHRRKYTTTWKSRIFEMQQKNLNKSCNIMLPLYPSSGSEFTIATKIKFSLIFSLFSSFTDSWLKKKNYSNFIYTLSVQWLTLMIVLTLKRKICYIIRLLSSSIADVNQMDSLLFFILFVSNIKEWLSHLFGC